MNNITYIRDDWFPHNLTDAKDMTAGGLSSFGGGITKVFASNEIKFRTQLTIVMTTKVRRQLGGRARQTTRQKLNTLVMLIQFVKQAG